MSKMAELHAELMMPTPEDEDIHIRNVARAAWRWRLEAHERWRKAGAVVGPIPELTDADFDLFEDVGTMEAQEGLNT